MVDTTATVEPEGSLDVLNCGAGHLSFMFEKDNPDEIAKAKKVIQDMLRRGYTILVATPEGGTRRVKRFDPNTDEYIIEEPEPEKPKATRRLPYRKTKATGIGRTAGG